MNLKFNLPYLYSFLAAEVRAQTLNGHVDLNEICGSKNKINLVSCIMIFLSIESNLALMSSYFQINDEATAFARFQSHSFGYVHFRSVIK